jgi:hypothetical protein
LTELREYHGVKRLCMLIGFQHDSIHGTMTRRWIPIPEGMTEEDFGRKFFDGFDLVELASNRSVN